MLSLLLIIAGVVIYVVLQALAKIPADPPCIALVTLFGEPIPKVKKNGYRLFFFRPFVFGYILIDVSKKNSKAEDIPSQLLRAPDRAELEFYPELTWMPQGDDAKDLIEGYIKSGREDGVWNILRGIVQEKLRQFVTSSIEGPQTGEKMLEAGDDCVAILLKAIAGEELQRIPSEIPTLILLHYSQKPRPLPLPEEKDIAGENWEKIDNYLTKLPSTQKDEIEQAVEERRKVIQSIKNGNGSQKISHLGIIITRLNLAQILPKGEFARTLELKPKEEQERKAEIFETETDLMKAEQLCQKMSASGEKISLQKAFETILKWKATREGHGFTFPGGPELPIGKLATKWLTEQMGGGK